MPLTYFSILYIGRFFLLVSFLFLLDPLFALLANDDFLLHKPTHQPAEDDDDLTGSPQLNGWVGPHTNGSHLLKSINGTNGTNGTNGN